MCNIMSVTNIGEKVFLNCSKYDGEFLDSKKLTIVSDNEIYETNDFVLEKTRSCFNDNNAPWIMMNNSVPERFLKSGNQILLQ